MSNCWDFLMQNHQVTQNSMQFSPFCRSHFGCGLELFKVWFQTNLIYLWPWLDMHALIPYQGSLVRHYHNRNLENTFRLFFPRDMCTLWRLWNTYPAGFISHPSPLYNVDLYVFMAYRAKSVGCHNCTKNSGEFEISKNKKTFVQPCMQLTHHSFW